MNETLKPSEKLSNLELKPDSPEVLASLESLVSLLAQQVKPGKPATYIRQNNPNKDLNLALQKFLQLSVQAPKTVRNRKGENVDWADGDLGKNTIKQVKIMQSQLGLSADGVIGKDVLGKLNELQDRLKTLVGSHDEQSALATLIDPEETEKRPTELAKKLPNKVEGASDSAAGFEGLSSSFIDSDGGINSSKPTINQILPNKDSAYVIEGRDGRTTTVLWNGKDFTAIGDYNQERFKIYKGDKIISPADFGAAKAAHEEKLASDFPAKDIPLNKLAPVYLGRALSPRQKEVAELYEARKNSPLARKVRANFSKFGEEVAEQAVLVSVSESNCQNINDKRNRNGSRDYGPIQVNTVHLNAPNGIAYKMGITTKDQLRNPDTSLRVAAAVYQEAGSWNPWYGAGVIGLRNV